MPAPSPRSVPRATYRVQVTPEFGFDAVREILPYLRDLGVSHVYLSPCLKSVEGSRHGYDVVDPQRVDDARGGEAAFEALLLAARESGLGVVLDIVPNHLAASEANPWWWDVLARGPESAYAEHFDIDWDDPDPALRGRLLLPILGSALDEAIDEGSVRVVESDGAEPRLGVYDRQLPLSPASVSAGQHRGDLRALLDAQHYVLAFWRDGLERLNWRRFFDVTELVGARVEREEVFRDTHRLVLDRTSRGLVGGLRIDHPDGLRDPTGYARRLREAAPGAWIVVEKILEPGEELPASWPVDGTTGYDFLAAATGLFVDPAAEAALSDVCRAVTGACPPFAKLRHDKQQLAVRELFPAETARVARLFGAAWGEGAPAFDVLRRAVEAVVVSMPVYRTYVPEDGRADTRERRWLDAAFARAATDAPRPDPGALRRLLPLLTGDDPGGRAGGELRARFQQLTGPAMAKGLEDTALYCDRRLVCLNEVGSDPEHFGTSRETFHALCGALQTAWPDTMTALSTHDTKRSADLRLRIAALSEIPERWGEEVRIWRDLAVRHRASEVLPLPGAEYLLHQTLVGCWPADVGRIVGYMRKAAREAKLRTSWLDPDPEYEAALESFVRGALGDPAFLQRVQAFVSGILPAAHVHGLSLALVQLTAVGVPDVYQGCETWRESLTDPDNRRPVDFDGLQADLARAAGLGPDAAWAEGVGLAKLWLTHRVLALRRRYPESFGRDAAHVPLAVSGPDERRAIAFCRGDRVAVVAPRFVLSAGGRRLDFRVQLPAGRWRSAWGDREPVGAAPTAARLFERFPVALLLRDDVSS